MSFSTFKLAFSDRRRALAFGVALLLIVAIATSVTIVASGVLRRPPTQVALDPKAGQKEVGLDQPLKIFFSRPVPADRVEASFRVEPALDGAMRGIGTDHRHYSWEPTGPWTDLTTYTVTMLPLKDGDGVLMPRHVWHFTTTIVPRVTSLMTDNGATAGEGAELPLASNLKVAFNAAMATSTVTLLLNGIAAELSWSDDGRMATFPTKAIPAGGLDLGLGPGGKDRSGHVLSNTWTLHVNLLFTVTEHTIPLPSPALLQIPNDNYGARDQSGLQAASIVFEYVTEGGITRLSALFMNVPDVIGPIRSGRLISFKLTRHYHGINYFSGLSAGSFAVLDSDPVPTLFDTQGVYYRSRDRVAPNNLYTTGSAIRANQVASGRQFPLATGAPLPLPGDDALSASVPEHNSSYAYDSATGTYLKTEEGRA